MNVFADISSEEWSSYLKQCVMGNGSSNESETLDTSSLDWRQKGVVTEAKNHQQCGSRYSFSSAGSFEGPHAQKKNKLVSFSEQQIVDCSAPSEIQDYVFKYVSSQSIEPAADYPYTAQQGTCHYKAIKTVFKNTASKDVHEATTTLWLPLLLNNRSRSVLRLTHQHSNCTLVSSMTHHAEPNSTTMSWLSDMMLPKELTIG